MFSKGQDMMRVGTMERLIQDDPSLADFKIVILTHEGTDFVELNIDRLEFDDDDKDINIVPSDSSIPVTLSEFLEDIRNFNVDAPLFIREYFDPPMIVEDDIFTHQDTPVFTYAIQGESRKIGLFAWFEEIEAFFGKL